MKIHQNRILCFLLLLNPTKKHFVLLLLDNRLDLRGGDAFVCPVQKSEDTLHVFQHGDAAVNRGLKVDCDYSPLCCHPLLQDGRIRSSILTDEDNLHSVLQTLKEEFSLQVLYTLLNDRICIYNVWPPWMEVFCIRWC